MVERRHGLTPGLKLTLVIGIIVVLIGGGIFLFPRGTSIASFAEKAPHVIVFYADWWKACQQMAPIVDGLEQRYGKEIRVVRVNVDRTQGRKLARELGVIGQPAFIFFGASGQEVRRLVGIQTAETLQREFERCLSCTDGG